MNPVNQHQNAAEEEITISKSLYDSLLDDSIELKERKRRLQSQNQNRLPVRKNPG